MNKKSYFLIVLLIAVLVFSLAFSCSDCTGKKEELKFDKTVDIDQEREVTWVTEEDSSGEPEDVEDLTKASPDTIKLEGQVQSPFKGLIYLYVDQNNIVNGEVLDMGWYEDIAFETGSCEGDEDHHHGEQTVKCLIKFNGDIWGKIDENSQIYADLGGTKSIEYAMKSDSIGVVDKDMTSIVKDIYKTKPDSFTLKGTYHGGQMPQAEGFLLPDNYSWNAVSYTFYE